MTLSDHDSIRRAFPKLGDDVLPNISGETDDTEEDRDDDTETDGNETEGENINQTPQNSENTRALRSKGPVDELPHVMEKPIEYDEYIWNGMIFKVPKRNQPMQK